MKYYYNQATNSFAITTNFAYNPIPNGYVEITKEEYDRLQEELNKDINENVESDEVTSI